MTDLPNPADLAKLQAQTKKLQNILQSKTVTVSSNGITIVINLEMKVQSVEIDPDMDMTDLVKLEIAMKSAFNEAVSTAQQEAAKTMMEAVKNDPSLLNFGGDQN